MTERWNNRALFRLLWPFVIEQVLGVTMGAADTVMVSSVGEFAVSGVNIIDNINNLLIIAFISLATGGAVVCSQYIGRQDTKNVRLASRQLVYSVTIVSLVITVLALLFRRPVIRAFYGAIDNDVMNAAMIYFLITNLSNPLLALYNSCAALFRAAGNSQVPMRVALLVNVIHIAVNAYFLFVLHIGVAGVALSTFLSRAIAAGILLGMLVKNRHYPVSLAGIQKIKLDFPMIRKILNIGLPTGLEQSMFQFGRLLTQRVFPFFGTSIIAANAVASVINSFSFMTGNAFALALITVVGQCIGAGDFETAKNYTAKIIKVTWLSTFIISAAIFAFRGSLLDLFRLSPEAHAAARSFVTVHCFSMAIGWTFSFALPSALRAAGDARYIMVVGTVSMWLVRVFFAYFLSLILKLGPIGVWFAMGGDFVFRGIFFIFRWKSGRWQKIKVIDT